MTLTRRRFAIGLGAIGVAPLGLSLAASLSPAAAAVIQPYSADAFAKATKGGGPVFVHVYAPWCLQCRAQEVILNRLMVEPKFTDAAFFRVSYDNQKEVVEALNVPRSTLIAYRGPRETGRMSWGVTEDSVVKVLDTAYART
ncbi:MAG: hypothetical protein B7Y70_01400 [Rhizobiales bacterium 35-68-8]|nr:MAG: hypothetical protein B7Y70_01400 [Rhizobiales bacterium 35-68-8]